MFDLVISNQVYPSWNDSAKMRVKAGLAFLPADFERVIVTLEIVTLETVAPEFVPKEHSEQWQYCCTIKAREVGGRWHTVRASDFDAHHALEHAIHVIARSARKMWSC